MKETLEKWFAYEAVLIDAVSKSYTYYIINYLFCLLFVLLFAYSLLVPSQGRSPVDLTFLLFYQYFSFRYFLFFVLFIGILFLRNGAAKRHLFTIGILLLLFTALIAVRNLFGGDDLRLANISLCLLTFSTSAHLAYHLPFFRKLFPFTLLCIFIIYGIIVLVETALHPIIGFRLDALFNHPNHLGNVLAFALVFCFSIAISQTHTHYKILLFILVSVMIFSLVHTLSRGAWIGGLFGIAMSVYCLRRTCAVNNIMQGLAIMMLVICGSIIIISPGSIAKRFSIDSRDVSLSIGNRLVLWRTTSGIIHDHWLSGVGLGYLGEYMRCESTTIFAHHGYFDTAMNNYLTLAAETGLPILLLYIACLFTACRSAALNIHGNGGLQAGINVGLLCGISSMLVFALFTYTLSRVYATTLLWASLGYILSQANTDGVIS